MYLQDSGPPDLTKWLPILGLGLLGLYNVWEIVKRGWRGRKDDQQKEITAAVQKWQQAHAEESALAQTRKEQREELERKLKEKDEECEHLRAQVRERGRIERDMQSDLMTVQGNYDVLKRDYRDLEKRLRDLEGGGGKGAAG